MTRKARKHYKPRIEGLCKSNIDKFCVMIEQGMFKSVAIESLGIHRTTLAKWFDEADEVEGVRFVKYPETREQLLVYLVRKYSEARAKFHKIASSKMMIVGANDWRMWCERLARQYPDEFGERRDISIDIKGSPARQVLDKVNELGLTEEGLDIPPVPPVPSSSPRKRGGK